MSLPLTQEVSLGSAALSELERCALTPLIVVVRADDDLKWLPPADGKSTRRTETCLTAHLGLSFSLRCGLNAALPMQPDAVIVALADQPFITAAMVSRLIDTYERDPGLDYVASASLSEGLAMPPALFSKAMFPVLQGLDGDKGAAAILRSTDYKGRVLETGSAHSFMDADTQADFGVIRKVWSLRGGSGHGMG